MKEAVIDASVVLKWYLPEEQGERALSLLEGFVSNHLHLVAPYLLEYEVINGLVVAARRGRITEEDLTEAVDGFLSLGIPLESVDRDFTRVIHFCSTYGVSAYDAGYLALAERRGIPLVTADERLCRAVRDELHWLKRIGDL